MKLIIQSQGVLKASPLPIVTLKKKAVPDQLLPVSKGDCLELTDYSPLHGADDDHIFIQLANHQPKSKAIRWYVHGENGHIEGTEPGNNPKDEPASKPTVEGYGPQISIPGISRPVGIYEPIYFEPTPCNFTWAEFTKGGSRIPVNATVTVRLVKLAQYMDRVREYLGNHPIRVTSGYRDPVSNRAVGGARDSRHMYGDAIDFSVQGMNVVDVFYKLKQFHPKGGLAVGFGFVHLDQRPGAPARWLYPGGPRVALW